MTSVPPAVSRRVLVTDPEQRAALAAVRSLGARGWHVHSIGASRGLAGRSRWNAHFHRMADGCSADPIRYREAMRQAVVESGCAVIVPVTDNASRMLLGFDEYVGATVAGPTAEAYARASDKAALMTAAKRIGIRVPEQVTLESPATVERVVVPFDSLVVKPARSVVEVEGRTVRVGVRFCADAAAVSRTVQTYPAEAYPLLLQERILGDGMGVFLFRNAGATQLVFGHRRLREKPPAGGVSTYRESWQPPSTLVARCEALLDALRYEGAAMIEFKQDASTGDLVLMEINARLWGSVQLALDAGVDFPVTLVEAALGLPLSCVQPSATAVRSVWELGELDHALAVARKAASALDLPEGTPTGWGAAIRALLDHRLSDRPEVFRLSDPMPFVAELARWVMRR